MLPAFVISAILTFGGFSLLNNDSDLLGGMGAVGSLVGVAGMLIVVGFGTTFAPAGYYQRRLAERFPDSRVITTETGMWLADATRELLPPSTTSGERPVARARLQSYLVLGEDGISFWSRDQLVLRPFLAVPRARIRGISSGFSNPRASAKAPFAMIRITRADGSDYALSFTPQAPRFRGVMRTIVWQETIVKWMTTRY